MVREGRRREEELKKKWRNEEEMEEKWRRN